MDSPRPPPVGLSCQGWAWSLHLEPRCGGDPLLAAVRAGQAHTDFGSDIKREKPSQHLRGPSRDMFFIGKQLRQPSTIFVLNKCSFSSVNPAPVLDRLSLTPTVKIFILFFFFN